MLCLLLISSIGFSQDHTSTIQNYLSNSRAQLGLESNDVQDFKVSSQSHSKSLNADNVYIDQQIQGIPVMGTTSPLAIRNGQVVYGAVDFIANATQKINATAPSITPAAAITNAATAFNLGAPQGLTLVMAEGNSYKFNTGGISLNEIPVQLVYEENENGALRLAWDLSIYQLDANHYYSTRVDAITGEILSTNDWVLHCEFGTREHTHTANNRNLASILDKQPAPAMEVDAAGITSYRVFPLPLESPQHGPDQIVPDPADPVASPFGWHDTDGVPGAEFTITRGNNVLARDDIDGNNIGGFSPDGGAALVFDFPFNLNTAPVNMLEAATTNLFYWNNIMHDVWYQYGFDEASGNFQDNNYGNGGTGGDIVDAQSQDGSGLNNANFATPPDGSNPRMQMFLWNAVGPSGEPFTILNGPLAGDYDGVPATFGATLPEGTPITGELAVVVDDNAGVSVDPQDACDTIINGADIDGKIVVIRRGECEFGFKILAAENEGAIAVIMVNNVATAPIAMGPGDVGDLVTIPAIMISQADGDALIASLLAGDTINGELINDGPFMIDGDLDNGIIAHEYGHGISNRLTGGRFNSNCLSTQSTPEQMGEGWSDWFGLMLTMKATDQREDIQGIGTFATGQPIDGQGIREAPYSTSFAINDYTFNDINGNVSVPHGVGFVWATMLWEMTWDLIDEYGFDQDLYNGTGGNNIAMQLVIDGLKLQGCNPGFIAGRDAILEADMLANGGANQCLIWGAFARRGLGFSADGGSPSSLSDQTEGYDVPSDLNCILGNEDRGAASNFVIFPNPSNGSINIKSLEHTGDAMVSIFDLNGRKVFTQAVNLQRTTAVNALGLNTGVYIITIDGDNYSHNAKLIIE